MTEDISRAILEQDNAKLTKEVEELRALLSRPVAVTIQGPDAAALKQVVQYLPQLTHISTNLSQIASALQRNEQAMGEIADALKGAQAIKMPQDRQPKKNGPDMRSRKVNDNQGSQSWFTTTRPIQ